MNYRSIILVLAAAVLVSALLLRLFAREASAAWSAFAVHPEIRGSLRAQLGDLRTLARLNPAQAAEYRKRFETTRNLLFRTEVLEMNRDAIMRRYEEMLLAAIVVLMTLTAATYVLLRRRDEQRLAQLRLAIVALSKGEAVPVPGGGDLIGRVFTIVGETAEVVARDRRRLSQLDHLASWQESARRIAHELRTPLTAARLEAERVQAISVIEELDVLASFTSQFTSFAALGPPALRPECLHRVVSDFVERFGDVWPGTRLLLTGHDRHSSVSIDREMIRRVLVNLTANSALAGARTVELQVGAGSVDVIDDAGGIDASVVSRIFTPYVTTRTSGEGMGLGLAISKKILLDHGGDLELIETGPRGTRFRLTLPLAAATVEAR
jgi:two-component system nitrogen regulation sensor histidine kinase NtrY